MNNAPHNPRQLPEVFICPVADCSATIPQCNTESIATTTGDRLITIVCPNCLAIHRATFARTGEQWTLLGNIERVKSPSAIKSARKRIVKELAQCA